MYDSAVPLLSQHLTNPHVCPLKAMEEGHVTAVLLITAKNGEKAATHQYCARQIKTFTQWKLHSNENERTIAMPDNMDECHKWNVE